jgi:hypothetical protein
MTSFDPSTYSPAFAALLGETTLSPLGPGQPVLARKSSVAALSGDDAFLPRSVVDRDAANACRAGLWLLYNFLDESHAISQELPDPDGAYWHGLMHRREMDFSNSKYWFRRVGDHPIFPALHAAARESAAGETHSSARFLATGAAWDPFAFVDLCEASLCGRSPCEDLCRRIQQREWQLLFDYCYRKAVRPDGTAS